MADALGNDEPKLAQKTADLIGLRRTRLDEPLAHTMHR